MKELYTQAIFVDLRLADITFILDLKRPGLGFWQVKFLGDFTRSRKVLPMKTQKAPLKPSDRVPCSLLAICPTLYKLA